MTNNNLDDCTKVAPKGEFKADKPFCLEDNQICGLFIPVMYVQQAIKLLKEEFKTRLCQIGFTDNSHQNKVIRYLAHSEFERIIDKIFGETLTNG